MQLCQCLDEVRIEYAESEAVALIQRGKEKTTKDVRDKVEISYAQMYRWQQKLRDILCQESGENEWLIAINLMPFSIEETAMMLLVAEQRHWTYVAVDMQLSIARQLYLLQRAGVRHLVTTVNSGLVKALVGDEDRKVEKYIKSWTIDSKTSPFVAVQVVAFPSNYFEAEVSLTWQRLRDCQEFVAPLYVLFTSGTTDKAKRVLGTRKGAWTRLTWMWKTYPFSSYDVGKRTSERVLRATKLSFVDSVWEIIGAFLQRVPLVHMQSPRHQVGSNIHSCTTSVVLDNSQRFLEIICSETVTRFTAVPSVLEVLLLQTTEIHRRSYLAGLRYVLSSGESLSLHVLQQLTASLPEVTVLNLYGKDNSANSIYSSSLLIVVFIGSTEVSGDITCMELKAPFSTVQMADWQEYGVPIASLDQFGVIGGSKTSLVLVPEGLDESALCSSNESTTVIWPKKSIREVNVFTEIDEKRTMGVLYVSGPLLTCGYLGDNLDNVFAGSYSLSDHQNESNRKRIVQPSRWFCTGDTCSAARGRLYFCGRIDNAVKIHGQRVYMEAVERAVACALKETTRDLQFNDRGQVCAFTFAKAVTKPALLKTCIVACIVCDDMSNPAIARYSPTKAFNAWMGENYGTSHIPHEMLMLSTKAVPRLAHGKIDRRALETFVKHFISDCNVVLPRPRIDSKPASTPNNLVARLLNEILDISPSNDVFDDNLHRTFRDLGGNSLLATLFVHELRIELDELSFTSRDLLEMTVEDIMSRCAVSFLAQEHSRKMKKGKSLMKSVKPSSIFNTVTTGASGIADDLKRQKKTHHATSEDNVGSYHRSSSQQSRLMFVSRCNHSSASVNGLYLPTCYTSLLSSAKETVLASSSCLSWELRSLWQVNLDKCIDASPTVVQHRDHKGSVCSTWAIIGSHSAQLVCVDVMKAGQEIWRVTLDDRIEACAAISVKHEVVYVGTYAGTLFALSLQSGLIRWKFHAKGIIKATALVMDDQRLVVGGAYDNMLYGLDTLTGTQRWVIDLHGSIFATPLCCAWSGQLFSATTNGIIVALLSSSNFACVEEQWKLKLSAPVFAGLNADHTSKMLIVGCADGQLYGASMDTGSIQWKVSTEKPIFSSPCIYQPGSIVFGSHDGMLRKADCHSGKLAWTTNLYSAIFASPTVVRLRLPTRRIKLSERNDDDRLICCVTTTAGGMYFCDESTGSIVYQTCESTGKAMSKVTSEQCKADLGPLFSSPVMIDNYCLLGTRTNHFYGFELVCNNSAATAASLDDG
ncbi:unnamed protein product [Peronospora belbahrii]|uniref:Carrier domain-containing protein n=1 Tax=Peronospora belbahrii TaxID=622444 RepID=A0AAU9KV92_9STRA|nr:unnamed protein product [Peronospora belbahrii]